ncbi:MAG: hypothetical protein IKR34_03225 [Candidatus Gastranaerophilales bacterium]|nr:hypothetical protein [Candidatus Gastranaerophilales bacterium]
MVTKSQSSWKVEVNCILSYPNEKEFVIIDFKTSDIPENLDIKESKNGKTKYVINSAVFYSIKNWKEKFYICAAPESDKLSPIDKNALEAEFLGYAKRFLFLFGKQGFQFYFEYQMLQAFSYPILYLLLKYHQREL